MEELSAVDALVQLSFAVQAILAEAAASQDLSVIQLRLLGVLRDREPGMQELAGHLGLDKSSVTGLVDRAEKRGLVRRTQSQLDRRAVTVSLSTAGRRLVTKVASGVGAAILELASGLTAQQQKDLTKLATKVLAGQ